MPNQMKPERFCFHLKRSNSSLRRLPEFEDDDDDNTTTSSKKEDSFIPLNKIQLKRSLSKSHLLSALSLHDSMSHISLQREDNSDNDDDDSDEYSDTSDDSTPPTTPLPQCKLGPPRMQLARSSTIRLDIDDGMQLTVLHDKRMYTKRTRMRRHTFDVPATGKRRHKLTMMHELRKFYDLSYRIFLVKAQLRDLSSKSLHISPFVLRADRMEMEAKWLFSLVDVKGTGFIKVEALRTLINKASQIDVKDEEVECIMATLDKNCSGEVDDLDFLTWYSDLSDVWLSERRRVKNDPCKDTLLLKRESIKFHPRIIKCIKEFWLLCDDDGNGTIDFDEYLTLSIQLQRSMVNKMKKDKEKDKEKDGTIVDNFDSLAALATAKREWIQDSQGYTFINYSRFQQCFFQIADSWALTPTPLAYYRVLLVLLRKTSKINQHKRKLSRQRRRWKKEDEKEDSEASDDSFEKEEAETKSKLVMPGRRKGMRDAVRKLGVVKDLRSKNLAKCGSSLEGKTMKKPESSRVNAADEQKKSSATPAHEKSRITAETVPSSILPTLIPSKPIKKDLQTPASTAAPEKEKERLTNPTEVPSKPRNTMFSKPKPPLLKKISSSNTCTTKMNRARVIGRDTDVKVGVNVNVNVSSKSDLDFENSTDNNGNQDQSNFDIHANAIYEVTSKRTPSQDTKNKNDWMSKQRTLYIQERNNTSTTNNSNNYEKGYDRKNLLYELRRRASVEMLRRHEVDPSKQRSFDHALGRKFGDERTLWRMIEKLQKYADDNDCDGEIAVTEDELSLGYFARMLLKDYQSGAGTGVGAGGGACDNSYATPPPLNLKLPRTITRPRSFSVTSTTKSTLAPALKQSTSNSNIDRSTSGRISKRRSSTSSMSDPPNRFAFTGGSSEIMMHNDESANVDDGVSITRRHCSVPTLSVKGMEEFVNDLEMRVYEDDRRARMMKDEDEDANVNLNAIPRRPRSCKCSNRRLSEGRKLKSLPSSALNSPRLRLKESARANKSVLDRFGANDVEFDKNGKRFLRMKM